jgi:hypothetical protein
MEEEKDISTEAATVEPMIYIGPGFRDSRLKRCMIFSDGIPSPECNDTVLKRLFVPASQLNEALRDVETKGTSLNTFYRDAVKKHEEGK